MFIIYLSDRNHPYNSYGYWTGKKYVHQYEYYPITDSGITERTKRYKNRKVAENACEKCLELFAFVSSAIVKEVDN